MQILPVSELARRPEVLLFRRISKILIVTSLLHFPAQLKTMHFVSSVWFTEEWHQTDCF